MNYRSKSISVAMRMQSFSVMSMGQLGEFLENIDLVWASCQDFTGHIG